MTDQRPLHRSDNAPTTAPRSELDAFLADLKQRTGPSTRGRLIFALDATASREATWDTACKLQAEMFQEAATVGSLDMQLVYYRGLDECRASRWLSDAAQLGKTMSQIMCRAGETQLEKVLTHAAKETKLLKVSADVPRRGKANQGRLLPLRSRCRASTRRAPARRCSLCRRRNARARRTRRCQRRQAAWSAAVKPKETDQ